jgi:spore coat polysaccharide biosynthesis protein SpsF
MRPPTEQETFWAGEFGDAYTNRNVDLAEQRVPFFKNLLRLTPDVESVCDLGANVGHNLIAILSIVPSVLATGVELNPFAFRQLSSIPGITAVHSAIQDYAPERRFDLVFTCGVLIHVNPHDLPEVYRKMAVIADKYVLINEYFNPTPTEIVYRGHSAKLFKRDFAGEFLDSTEGFEPVRWGFLWKRMEPAWDNCNWTLLRRMA